MATFSPWPWRTTVASDLAALEERRAELHVGALAHQQHLAELDRGAGLRIQLFDAQNAVLA